MSENPYKFIGPLDPIKDRLVCAPREKEITKIIDGIKRGDYWSILGPRQIGKTTLLRQLMHSLQDYHHIYIDMESSYKDEGAFYVNLLNTILKKIPAKSIGSDIKTFASEGGFYDFLNTFEPQEEKPIIFFFDEIEKTNLVNSFLHLWRKVFHERDYYNNLKKHIVIASGMADLSSLTAGENGDISPFNIAQTLYLTEIDDEEAEKLITNPFNAVGVEIEPEAKEKIILQTNGHPQLLQHLCYMLIEDFTNKTRKIDEADVEAAIDRLFLENTNLKTLSQDIKTGRIPRDLIMSILSGEEIDYLPYHDLSITGSGPIVRDGRFCAIRNYIYKEYLKQVIGKVSIINQIPNTTPILTPIPAEPEFKTTIYFDEQPPDFGDEEQEKEFLKRFFKSQSKRIDIQSNNKVEILKGLSFKEELIFCYLAYKNYKATKKDGISDWKSIPPTYQYYLSSSKENNLNQVPEWEAFNYALKRIDGLEYSGESIKNWIHEMREKLKEIAYEEIIFSKKGRGSGYLLKGTVHFEIKNQ